MNFRLSLCTFLLGAAWARADLTPPAPPGGPSSPTVAPGSNPPAASPPPEAVILDPVVVSDTLDQERGAILPDLGATAFGIEPGADPQPAPGSGRPRSTRCCCARPASPRIRRPTATCTSAANTRICSTASTTCSCRKASRASAWNSIRASSTACSSSPARCRPNTASAPPASWTSQTKSGAFEHGRRASLYGGQLRHLPARASKSPAPRAT